MISDMLDVIALGRKLIETISDLRRDIHSVRSAEGHKKVHANRIEAVEGRLADLELQAKEQNASVAEIEQGLTDALRAAEALAERVSAIFWIALIGCVLGIIGLLVSAVALTRTIR